MDEIEQIQATIAALEAQRQVLGDAIVDTALAPLREKLASLEPQPLAEQRRLVTILFADLVGFTAMSAHRDPEDVREIINAYFTRWTACIEKAGGVVEKFIGDAVMAVFGLTASREDDPENAVQAALEMRQALMEMNPEVEKTWGLQLAMRVGIHTGTVMVSFLGERKGQAFVVVGDTVNLASRLQSAASPGGILISQDTFRHVRGIFDLQILDPVTVKGKEEPVQVYQVLQAKRRSFRMPTRGVEGIETHMVGREPELSKLKEALLSAIESRKTQVVTVVGDAGIGKSRLIAEFDLWVELLPQVIRYYKGRASPAMQNLPYSLLRDLFSFRFQIYDSDSPQVVQEKIERGIGEFAPKSPEEQPYEPGPRVVRSGLAPEVQMRAHWIAHLLGFRVEDSPYLQGARQDPRDFRDRALAYLSDYFKTVTAARPVVLLLEDIHWADDSSLDILQQLVERLAGEPLLVVCATRPNFFERYPDWAKGKNESQVPYQLVKLAPLSQPDSQRLVNEILQKVGQVPESLRELVVNSAEGNPFFLEELIKMLIEEAVILKEEQGWRIDLSRLESVHIPSTLVEVLQARFDSLSAEERVLLQRASVIGRTFWDGAVSFMERGQEDRVQIGAQMGVVLHQLSTREMVFPHPVSSFEATHEFYFKHALLRDVTYESVLKRLRKVYHAYAAGWLETVTEQSQRSNEYAALIAEHYEHAGNREKARAWYSRAADQAIDHYANEEGIRCLTRCLELTPDGETVGKFDVLLRRVKLYDMLSKRPAQRQDLDVLQALAEKLDGQKATGDQPQASRRAKVTLQEWVYYDAAGDAQSSLMAARQAIAQAQSAGDKESEVLGNLYLGATCWKQSDFPAAREYITQALALARSIPSPSMEADSLRNLGIVLQYQGNLPQARANYEESLRIYHEDGNEKGESMALNSLGSLILEQGLYREARTYFERALALKRKIGHRRAEHVTLLNLGIVADKLGDFGEAYKILEEVLRFAVAVGDRDGENDVLNSLGGVAIHSGDYAKARSYLEIALTNSGETGSETTECEVLASLANLSHCLGEDQAAHQYSQAALALAQELNLPHLQANSLIYAGHALLGLERAGEARQAYEAALALAGQGGEPSKQVEIQAGLARVCLAQGALPEAAGIAEEILAYLTGESQVGGDRILEIQYGPLEGMDEPFRVLLTCIQVLRAIKDARAGTLLAAAYRLLIEQAARLGNETRERMFLGRVPVHREIQVEWKMDEKRASI